VKYARSPAGDNAPLSMWSNRWSTMPVHAFPDLKLPPPDHRAVLDSMPGSEIPVIRQPFVAGDPLPFWAQTRFSGHHLWNVDEDPGELDDRAGVDDRLERTAIDRLRAALEEVEAPTDHYERLGLT